jgi:tetratricopeptide (TPR) repeat protein
MEVPVPRLVPWAVLSLFVVGNAGAQPQDAVSEALRLYSIPDWPASVRAHEALVRDRPSDAQAWLRLGVSLQGAGRYADSVRPLQEAARLGAPAAGPVHFRLAKALARSGDVEGALRALRSAADGGFGLLASLDQDADLASVRQEPAFAAVRTAVERNARPCAFRPESRQLDFWIGEWDVTQTGAPAGVNASRSRIESVEHGCVIAEYYETPQGYAGRSYNAYEPNRKRWEQFWVDNVGGVHHYAGVARDGNMYYEAEFTPPGASAPTRNRMTFFNQGRDQVRQLGEQSTDGGRTWTVSYDLTYRRRGPS